MATSVFLSPTNGKRSNPVAGVTRRGKNSPHGETTSSPSIPLSFLYRRLFSLGMDSPGLFLVVCCGSCNPTEVCSSLTFFHVFFFFFFKHLPQTGNVLLGVLRLLCAQSWHNGKRGSDFPNCSRLLQCRSSVYCIITLYAAACHTSGANTNCKTSMFKLRSISLLI